MIFLEDLNFSDFIGHYTLLYGETNTKKTYFTSKFIQFLLETKNINPKEITILDFSPPLTRIKNLEIGGKIRDFYEDSIKCRNLLFEGDIVPPRLKSKNKSELYRNICDNFRKTSKILQIYDANPTKVLIINEISIYLHKGSKFLLLNSIKKSTTFLGNAYYGSSITRDYSTLLNLNEKRLVEYFIKKLDNSYYTE